ncbi:MAG TPA: hypothetical protein VL199_05280 [Burkholderiales bacterium]|nr:hypothetical protein [Burkholderiales bacterium]
MRNVKSIAVLLSVLATGALAGEPLRTVQDMQRNRIWALETDAVYLQEGTQKRRFELPGWMHVSEDYSCRPDLAVDAEGAVVVTSNAVSIVWRVNPASGQVTRHELILDADRGKDVGFTGLTYAADPGVFFAVSATHGTLWRIDPLLRRAQKIPTSDVLRQGCGLSVERTKTRRTVVLCVRGLPLPRRVYLAPDQRSAYVRYEPCLEPAAGADIAFVR